METITKIFLTYGWPGLVAVILVICFWYFITKQLSKQNKSINTGMDKIADAMLQSNQNLSAAIQQSNANIMQNISSMTNNMQQGIKDQNNQLISAVSDSQQQLLDSQREMIQYLLYGEDLHNKGLVERNASHGPINGILREILYETDADRTAILELHNQKANLDGLPFLWYDMYGEFQKKGVPTLSGKVVNLQASILDHIYEELNKNDNYIITFGPDKIEELYDDAPVLYDYLKEMNTQTVSYVGLYNDNNMLKGFLVVEYHYDKHFKEDSQEYLEYSDFLKHNADKISDLLPNLVERPKKYLKS